MPPHFPATRRPYGCALIFFACLMPGCAGVGEDDAEFDEDLADQLSTRWQLPADLIDVANAQNVSYDGAPSWNGGRNCSGTFTSGAMELAAFVDAEFPGVSMVDGYLCRSNTAQTSKTSIHGTGRAIDVFIPLAGGGANNKLGDPVANWLVEHAEEIGVQLIIWDRSQYSASRDRTKFRSYTGPHPHHDHLHVELNLAAAARMTPWFSGGSSVPSDPWIGTPCTEHAACDFDAGGKLPECSAWHDAEVDDVFGYCTVACEGGCPDAAGYAPTFCIDNGLGFGQCAATAGPKNDDCALIPGTEPRVMERFIGQSGAPAAVQTVCVRPSLRGPSCSTTFGECIDLDPMTCAQSTLAGQCPGGANIRCCPQ